MHDACEDLGQNYLKADIIQSLALARLLSTSSSSRNGYLSRRVWVDRQPY
eukprot:COSAG05_NODE_573_length_8601_cov_58.330981_7_plen_50_part_00